MSSPLLNSQQNCTGCIFESPEREDLLLLKVTAETTFVSQFAGTST